MTLREFWMLVVRHWVLVVVIAIACALLGFGYACLKDSGEAYEAEAQVVASSSLGSVAGFAENAARDMQPELEEKGITVDVSSASAIMTLTVVAEGPDSQDCVEVANSIADAANEIATEIYAQYENPYRGEVSHAIEATPKASKDIFKFMLAGFVGGLFIALVVLVFLDYKRRPVKTLDSIQSQTELPILDMLPAQNGEKLLANVRFATSRLGKQNDCLSVLVIPVGQSSAANEVVSLLIAAAESDDFGSLSIKQAQPLSESMDGAYAAKDADAVVVVVEQWKDSIPALVSCVDELQFADAKIAGLVFCKDLKRKAA